MGEREQEINKTEREMNQVEDMVRRNNSMIKTSLYLIILLTTSFLKVFQEFCETIGVETIR